MMAYFIWSQLEPILAIRTKDFGFTDTQTGVFFAILPVCYFASGFVIQFQPKWIDNKVYLILGSVSMIIGLLLTGPSQLLNLPESPVCMIIGVVLVGFSCPQLQVYALPEMITHASVMYPNQEEEVSAYCASIFNTFLGVGQIAGPLFGSNLSTFIGFPLTEDIAAIIMTVYVVIYFFFVKGYVGFMHLSRRRRRKYSMKS